MESKNLQLLASCVTIFESLWCEETTRSYKHGIAALADFVELYDPELTLPLTDRDWYRFGVFLFRECKYAASTTLSYSCHVKHLQVVMGLPSVVWKDFPMTTMLRKFLYGHKNASRTEKEPVTYDVACEIVKQMLPVPRNKVVFVVILLVAICGLFRFADLVSSREYRRVRRGYLRFYWRGGPLSGVPVGEVPANTALSHATIWIVGSKTDVRNRGVPVVIACAPVAMFCPVLWLYKLAAIYENDLDCVFCWGEP